MKTIGLIGGISWESTLEYYRTINETVRARLGKEHSARIIMHSIDFNDVENFVSKQDFRGLTSFISNAAIQIEKAGADCLLICANTMHLLAEDVQQQISIPLLHITDATAIAIKKQNISTVGLLGTAFTMEQGFYKNRLQDKHGIKTLIPDSVDRNFIQHVIFDELFSGRRNPDSKNKIIDIMQQLINKGAEGIILGCTEIPLLICQDNCGFPLFDTTAIHSETAVDFALKA